MISLADTLDASAGYFPPALLPPQAYHATRAVAAQLPAPLTRWTYLECRLGGRARPADLIIEVDADGRDLLAGANPTFAPGPEITDDPVWSRVMELCRRWRDCESPLRASIQCLWLEFDVAEGEARSVGRPGVFVGFTPEGRRGTPLTRHARITTALEPLLGEPLDRQRSTNLQRCLLALPTGACLLYAGSLLPRNDGSLRLCLNGIRLDDLSRYLRAIGWRGQHDVLESMLCTLDATRTGASAREPALLHLDVGAEGVRARLGLEYVFGRREQVHGLLPERGFVEHLVAAGHCTAGEAAALAAFPGCSLRTQPHELWRSLVVRRVNHVKLVLDADGSVSAKGYLVLHHRFWSGGRRVEARPGGSRRPGPQAG